jgi:hypothetical protein
MDELRQKIGRELPLDQFHLMLRRMAGQARGIANYGSCLVTCSDERQGALRHSFERDVASSLISDVTNARDRVFTVSNLCGRLEPGAFALVDDHFTRRAARGPKMLIIEIASHVGRIRDNTRNIYGQVERFGRRSACCGALTSLLNPNDAMGAVRHPWFEQLNDFFGPMRLTALREMDDSVRMIAAAIVHAALQAESAIADIFNAAPATPTEVLLIAGVAVNQQWADGFLPVACHHIRTDAGKARVLSGFGLRTTPEALQIDVSAARIVVEGGQAMENAPQIRRRIEARPSAADVDESLAVLEQLTPEQREVLDRRLDEVRDQVHSIRHDPAAWRTYARPVLRGLFRGLCVAQPELGLAALLYEGGGELMNAHKLRQLASHGHASADGRRVLHEIEAELQQLNHEDAQRVLEGLLSKQPAAT